MASTKVDFPEPMSPVSRVFSPRAVRLPDAAVEGAPVEKLEVVEPEAGLLVADRRNPGGASLIRPLSEPRRMASIGLQPGVELGQPLGVDEGFQDSTDFEESLLVL